MQRIAVNTGSCAYPLYDLAATLRFEQALAVTLPPHTLMQRAGLASARLAQAVAPHAQHIWIACGPGNNGGDGLEAALHLKLWGKQVLVTWLGSLDSAPADARASYARAQAAGVSISATAPTQTDLCIDALLGSGASRPLEGQLAQWVTLINALSCPVLALDLPTGLNGDTGASAGLCVQASHSLSLLTLKPGLFTAQGRDHTGEVWFESLGSEVPEASARARLQASPATRVRRHDSHKGSYGDLAVIGGAPGMTGAALLAASAALHAGAGRVFVCLLDEDSLNVDSAQPELMFRAIESLDVSQLTLVSGCGGGTAIAGPLAKMLSLSPRLVIDADGLNAIAADTQLQQLLKARQSRDRQTVLTPHPLEAARLLSCSAAQVQADRLSAAEALAQQFGCTVVLKGSGTVISSPEQISVINSTGNARLATAGTGDVLAGMIGAGLAAGLPAFQAACEAVWQHGHLADVWPATTPLTASALARQQI
jgi:hydroxyethylthiazole kinase-like uncharacterized protein yjeF